jgi:hypothetical protein
MTKKLEKVLEYLINNEEGKAKELLHQVFIEKARSIHEDLINMDEEMEMDEVTCGDEGEDFRHDVEDSGEELDELADEIEAEETMAEDEGLDIDMADDAGDDMDMDMDVGDDDGVMDMGDVDADVDADVDGETPDVEELADEMQDLEDALAELKAEFEKLEAGEESEEVADDEGAEDFEAGEEEEMDESWLAEFDDLDESVSLEKVPAVSGEGEVGSGKFAPTETNTKSPVGKAPTSTMGAKPVKTGEGSVKSGFNKETAPSTKGQLPHTEDNRRKKSTDKTAKVSKEGDNSAKLNKGSSEGFGEVGKKSPLSSSPRK